MILKYNRISVSTLWQRERKRERERKRKTIEDIDLVLHRLYLRLSWMSRLGRTRYGECVYVVVRNAETQCRSAFNWRTMTLTGVDCLCSTALSAFMPWPRGLHPRALMICIILPTLISNEALFTRTNCEQHRKYARRVLRDEGITVEINARKRIREGEYTLRDRDI